MTPKQALGILVAAFSRDRIEPATVQLYEQRLRDIPAQLLEATVKQVVDSSRFFPTIAELRQTAAQIAGRLPLTPEEAVAIIRKADVREPVYRRDGTLADEERFWVFPPDLPEGTRRAIQRVLEKLGDPVVRDEAVFGWENDFKTCYAEVAETIRYELLADLSMAALPPPSLPELEAGPAPRVPPGDGMLPCGYHADLGGRHRPDCRICAAAASGRFPTLPREALPEPVDVAENLAKVRELIANLSAKKALRMREEALAAGGDGKDGAS